MEYIQKTDLESKPTAGVAGTPQFQDSDTFIPSSSADMKNSDSDLNQTASSENLSAKYKYPRVSEDVPPQAQGQYEQP